MGKHNRRSSSEPISRTQETCREGSEGNWGEGIGGGAREGKLERRMRSGVGRAGARGQEEAGQERRREGHECRGQARDECKKRAGGEGCWMVTIHEVQNDGRGD